MKRSILVVAAILFGALFVSPPSIANRYEPRVAIFYDDLAPYGSWVEHRVYGTIWIPATAAGWRPYTYGRWVWTNEHGWYWDSAEEFGWATFHYGRWILTAEYGWAWVPDDVWGPAWVDWRYGNGYVGWSPMPPEYRWHGGAFVEASIDLTGPRYASNWAFVAERDFVAADIEAYQIPASRTPGLLRASVRVTNYAIVKGMIVNSSIDRARISAAAKVRIRPVRIGHTESLKDRGRIRAAGSVPLYRPSAVARTKLNIDLQMDLAAPTTRFESETRIDAPVTPPMRDGGRVDAGGGAIIERPFGGGIGTGIGTGLRIGR